MPRIIHNFIQIVEKHDPQLNLKKQTYMKKYAITLAAMALAIGGSVNFAGCSGEPDVDPDIKKKEAEQESVGAGTAEEPKKK
jgi:hypothetical protein|tara:strand:- start:375 stop:620 length:246 start_codon:yes stop_codon:yes gene_type:complete